MTHLSRWVFALTLLALLATGCQAASTVSQVADRPIDLGNQPAVVGEVLPAPDELPPAFSAIRTVGDLAFYYAVTDGQMRLIAFDAETLEGRYQLDAHPLGRIRGVGQGLVVDEELGLVFITGTSDENSEGAGFVAAHEATTGETMWRRSIDYNSAQPRSCGRSICLRSAREQVVLDNGTGDVVAVYEVGDRRVLLDLPTIEVSLQQSTIGRFLGVTGAVPGDRLNLWETPTVRIEAVSEAGVNPDLGWRADYDEENDAAIVYFANDEGTEWVTFGLDMRGGTVEWGRTDLDPCVESVFDDRPPIVCLVDRSTGLYDQAAWMNARSGRARWLLPLGAGVVDLTFDGTDLLVWLSDRDEPGYDRVDAETGEVTLGTTPVPCKVPNASQEFTYADGQPAQWSAGSIFTLCGPDGFFLPSDEAVAAAAIMDLGSRELWIVDDVGVPLALIGG